jgi:Cdc6-like AAA superfamily ATPase
MNDKFVITKNVRKFHTALQRLNHKLRGVERFGLVMGEIGLGKSEAAIQYGARSDNNIVMIRLNEGMTRTWFMRELIRELGLEPYYRDESMFNQLKEALPGRQRMIIIDEVDKATRNMDEKKISLLERFRDIHDVFHVPIVLIGEELIDRKLMKIPRLYDRIVKSAIVKFEKYDTGDVGEIVKEISDCKFDSDAIERISKESGGRIRPIMDMIHAGEGIAKANNLKSIGAKDFK